MDTNKKNDILDKINKGIENGFEYKFLDYGIIKATAYDEETDEDITLKFDYSVGEENPALYGIVVNDEDYYCCDEVRTIINSIDKDDWESLIEDIKYACDMHEEYFFRNSNEW